jgi:hypothetical protein
MTIATNPFGIPLFNSHGRAFLAIIMKATHTHDNMRLDGFHFVDSGPNLGLQASKARFDQCSYISLSVAVLAKSIDVTVIGFGTVPHTLVHQ